MYLPECNFHGERSKNLSISSISTSEVSQTDSAAEQAAVRKAGQQPKTSSDSTDQVKISAAAQALQLHRQGQSVSQIAQALSLTTKTVESYLGDSTTTTSSSSTSAQATGDAQGAALLAAL